ncbi:transcriptional antiterminator, partial [Vibrio anguillarum]|nr:transcriptional antiterminator [Vibrio anguillarum]
AKSEWVAFTNKLWKYQWLNRRDEVLTDEIRDCWYELSQGVLDIVVKLFVLAQLRAIASKLERITVNVLRSVYDDELKPVHPMLNAIRRGNPTLIAKYSDLRVEDIDKRLLSLHQKINQIPDEPELPFSNNEQAMRLYRLLVQTDCQSEILIPLVEKIFREQPKLTMREMMPVVLDWYDESKMFVDQQPKATVVKRADWSSLETCDLRFVYSQLTKKEDMYSALKANKLILDLKKV